MRRAARHLSSPAAVTVALVLVGCGSGADEPRLSAGSAGQLRALIGEVRGAAVAGDRPRALSAIGRFEALLGRMAARGALDNAELRALRVGARRVERRILLELDAGEPPPSPSPAEPEPLPPPEAKQPPVRKEPKGPKKPKGPKERHSVKDKR